MARKWDVYDYDELYAIISNDPTDQVPLSSIARQLNRSESAVSVPVRLFRACCHAEMRANDPEQLRIPVGTPPRLASPQVGIIEENNDPAPSHDENSHESSNVCRAIMDLANANVDLVRAKGVMVDEAHKEEETLREAIEEKETELDTLREELKSAKRRRVEATSEYESTCSNILSRMRSN